MKAEIAESGGGATYVHLDVPRESQWNDAVRVAVETYGKLDILVNSVGILIRRLQISNRFSLPLRPELSLPKSSARLT